MGRRVWSGASVLLFGLLCLSVVSLLFPFVIFRDAYVRFPFSPWQAIGLLIVSALSVGVGLVWKGERFIGLELMACGVWLFVLDVWLVLRIDTAAPLFLLGAVMIVLLLCVGLREPAPKNRPGV